MRRRILIAGALGLLTSLALAAGLGATAAYGDRLCTHAARLRVPDAGEGEGELRVGVFGTRGRVIIETAARRAYVDPTGTPAPEPLVPAWARREAFPWLSGEAPWPGKDLGDARVVRGTGWPFVALRHRYEWRKNAAYFYGGEFATPGGIRVEPSNGTPGAWPVSYPRAIPLIPVWWGLLADWALYAAAWALALWLGSLSLRHFARRPGHCPSCRYDLAGLGPGTPCPECGCPAPVPGRPS